MVDFLLGTANQGELRDVLVYKVKRDGVSSFALGVSINNTQPESSLHIVVGDLDVGCDGILPPVIFHDCSGFSGLHTCYWPTDQLILHIATPLFTVWFMRTLSRECEGIKQQSTTNASCYCSLFPSWKTPWSPEPQSYLWLEIFWMLSALLRAAFSTARHHDWISIWRGCSIMMSAGRHAPISESELWRSSPRYQGHVAMWGGAHCRCAAAQNCTNLVVLVTSWKLNDLSSMSVSAATNHSC